MGQCRRTRVSLISVDLSKNDDLAKWIDNLEGEKQGISLVALSSWDLLHSILKLISQAESLRHVTEDHISNFFATFVCCFKLQLNHIEEDSDHHELILTHSMSYFSGFWSLCTSSV